MRHQASSHNFLSVIFGILRQFWIGICGRNFSRRKFFDRKKSENFWSKKIWSKFLVGRKYFLIGFFFIEIFDEIFFRPNIFFDRKIFLVEKNFIENFDEKNPIKKYFRSTKNFDQIFFDPISFSTKNYFRQNVFGFFVDEKIFDQKIWLPIPMANFPKIPKIILRTASDHFKNTNSTHEKKVPFSPTKCCLGTLSLVVPLCSNPPLLLTQSCNNYFCYQ